MTGRRYLSIATTQIAVLDHLVTQTKETRIMWSRYTDGGNFDHFHTQVQGVKFKICLFERSGMCLFIEPNDDVIDWVHPFPRIASIRDQGLLMPLLRAIEEKTGERIQAKPSTTDWNYENILENALDALFQGVQAVQA
jgi:hypothetical protein